MNTLPIQFINFESYYVIIIFLSFVCLFILFTAFLHFTSDKMKIKNAFKKMQNKRIELAKENEYIKVTGHAMAIDNKVLIAPLSKKECLYYQVHVTKKTGKNSLETLVKEEKIVDFIIESSREKAIVKTNITSNCKRVHLVEDTAQQSNFKSKPSKHLEAYLNTHGQSSKNTVNTINYEEACIEIAEKIAVAGMANWEESDYKLNRYSSKILFLSGNKTNKLLITDDPKAIASKK